MTVSIIIGAIGLLIMVMIMMPISIDLIDEEKKEKMVNDIVSMTTEVWRGFDDAVLAMSIIGLVVGVVLFCMNMCEIGLTICFASMFIPLLIPIKETIDENFIK